MSAGRSRTSCWPTRKSGRTLIHKTPPTKDDPSRGVVACIGELCVRFDLPRPAIDHVLHGTTIGTNAVLEHDGAATGMITTDLEVFAEQAAAGDMGRHRRALCLETEAALALPLGRHPKVADKNPIMIHRGKVVAPIAKS